MTSSIPEPAEPAKKPGRYANRGGRYVPVRDNPARAAARAIYEGTPGMTIARLEEELGHKVAQGTLRRWKSEETWVPAARTVPDLAGRAGQLANTFKVKMAELGKPLSDEVAAAEVSKALSEEHAVNIRAAVLDRHRKEWAAPRKIAYDAIQKSGRGDVAGAFEMAKLAKITAETLQIVQVGECRAFGLNEASRSQDGGTVVLIEREQTPAVGHEAGPLPEIDVNPGQVSDDGEVF